MANTKSKPTTKKKTETKDTKPSAVAPNKILKLVIKAKDTKPAYQKAIKAFAQNTKSDGFRKGKVPLSQVEKIVGTDKIINQALNDLLPEAYTKLIHDEKAEPLTQPEIQVIKAEKDQDWEVEVQIAQRPEIKLGKYSAAAKKAHKEADAEIAKQEKEIAKAAKEADQKTKDEKLEINVPKLPTELNDQQKEDIRMRVIFHHLIESIAPQIPELLIKEDVRRQLDDLAGQLEQYKLKFEDYLARTGMTFDQLTGQMAGTSLASLQIEFILAEMIKDLNLKVEDKDYDEYLKKINSEKKASEIDDHTKSHLNHTILRRKVIDHLLSLK